MRKAELVIIGGGAAGMAAAVSARQEGIEDILILERSASLGGVLQQCIHNGFGIHRFGEDLTGVEFAAKYREKVDFSGISRLLNTFVIDMRADRTITAVSPDEGLFEIQAESIILAMGCRERSRNALLIPGARGAGILTAGTAQRYLNLHGYLPGRRIVIVGSGDIGLIMARQFVLEGCEVAGVVEIMPWSGGLPRNMKQCIEDFDIPVWYNSVIAEVRGKERVSSVLVGRVDADRRLIPGTEFEVPCDTLLISAGLIPENELTEQAGIRMDPATHGAVVTEDLQTSLPGVFACGNVLHVHDLVDFVSEEGERAGKNAAAWLRQNKDKGDRGGKDLIPVSCGPEIGGVIPQFVRRDTPQEEVLFFFRPRIRGRDAVVRAEAGGRILQKKRFLAVTPGEMCRLAVPAEQLSGAEEIRISIMAETSESRS